MNSLRSTLTAFRAGLPKLFKTAKGLDEGALKMSFPNSDW